MPVKLAIPRTDFAERDEKLKQLASRLADQIADLTRERGELALRALDGDTEVALRQAEVERELRDANTRRAGALDAMAANQNERKAWLAQQAEETRLVRRAEAGALVGELRRAAREADRAARKMAYAFENVHGLRLKLAEYKDATGIVRDQLVKTWSYESALAATGQFVVDQCGAKPVSRLTLVEQTEALFPNTQTKDDDDA